MMFGMIGMSIRRYILKPATLTTRDTTLLNPKARSGITIDSAIVTATFFTHTLARVFAESFYTARHDIYDAWQSVTSALAGLQRTNLPEGRNSSSTSGWRLVIQISVRLRPYCCT
ncbi:MAG: hypothetical protein U0X92_17055 [Anaerolineales bacterium]